MVSCIRFINKAENNNIQLAMRLVPEKDIQIYRRLFTYILPYRMLLALSLFAMVILAIADASKAAILKPMLDGAFIDNDPQLMTTIPFYLVGLFILSGVSIFIYGSSLHYVANKVVMDLKEQMFGRLLLLPSSFFDNQSTGSIISKFSYDVEQVKDATTNAIIVLVKDTLIITGLILWMLYLDWRMALITLIAGPFIVLIALLVRRRLREMSRKVQQTVAAINNIVTEVFSANRIIKLYGGHALEKEKFFDAINANRKYSMKFINATLISGPLVQLIAALALAIIIYYATGQAARGALSVGTFVSFFAALIMLLDALRRLIKVNEFIQRGLAACESIFHLLDQEAEHDPGIFQNQTFRGDIAINDLCFAYDDETPVIDNISVEINHGQTVAIVGESGSGKSTLVNLIPRFYDFKSGMILIDNKDIKEYSLGCLRKNIGYVSQDIKLFNDTIRNNIAYGQLRDETDEKIEQAARGAHAIDFINAMPMGFNTMVGEGGVKLSGGQRQRIALARALLKEATILILDEPTSSLDPDSERHIKVAISELKNNHTIIIIAHKVSTIEQADKIIVIKNGRVVQTGNHTELVSEKGAYSSLYAAGFDGD